MKARRAMVVLLAALLVTESFATTTNDSNSQTRSITHAANPSSGLLATPPANRPTPSPSEEGSRTVGARLPFPSSEGAGVDLGEQPQNSAQAEGSALAQQLLALKPESSFTNIGKLIIRGPKKLRREVAYLCRVIVTETNWTSFYSASHGTNALPGFSVEHHDGAANHYFDDRTNLLNATQIAKSFAGSDFSMTDLGLEFFHWPNQRVVKWEMKRSFGCKVLESRNTEPAAGGYSRVVSWIHTETGGLIQAEAYDVHGKLLKEFRPTETEKVNGRHELKEMEIENVQTGTRTTLVFEL